MARFVCSDPDVGDLEFADVEALLDALEAALVQPETPLFDAARQSLQAVAAHPEVRAAWEARLRYRPPDAAGLCLPTLPSLTALARSAPRDMAAEADVAERPVVHTRSDRSRAPRFALAGVLWALALLAVVGWVIVTFAARLADVAARTASIRGR